MNKLSLQVLKPGLFTTVQDGGRHNFMSFGVPKSGPMSPGEARKANWLVGNPDGHPLFEVTMNGPTIKLSGQGQVAFTGGTLEVFFDGQQLPMYQTININGEGDLRMGSITHGCRSYLSIRGDWEIKSWLGSFSAATQNAKILTPDSIISKGSRLNVSCPDSVEIRKLEPAVFEGPLRILPGPEYNLLNRHQIHGLLNRGFTLSHQSNRMAFRLQDQLTGFDIKDEIISSGVIPGTIQVAAGGQLMILMADAQTTGGYPRIANIINADLDRAGQLRPGDTVRFKLVSLKELHQKI